MAWWYVRRFSGETVGPLNDAGVEAELDAGRLMPNGWVCPSGGTQWLPVSAQRPFAAAVQRALVALGEAPTAYADNEGQQRQLAALYEASIEGQPPADLPPSKRPTDPPPVAPPGMQPAQPAQPAGQSGQHHRPARTVPMDEVPRGALERTASMDTASAAPYTSNAQVPAAADQHIVDNPLTEPFGFVGWMAIGLTALSALVYLADAVVLLFTPARWAVFIALLVSGAFLWATVQLVRRRAAGLRIAYGSHGGLLALLVLFLIVHMAMTEQFRTPLIIGVALVVLHAAALALLRSAQGLFWIR